MPEKAVFLNIGGRVQGVGYRYFAKYKADEFHISGWVRNMPDGNVEIEAEGDSQNLDSFISWLKIGPARSVIQQFSISETITSGYKSFTIR
ncbi:MAG: acylphosphatase [Prolixibacteraceae bacterium]